MMKIGEATICHQHQQVQNILENLLKSTICKDYPFSDKLKADLKESIEWIVEANDSAVRMENKLREYKEFKNRYKWDID